MKCFRYINFYKKLKQNWTNYHKRIQDFKQKQLMKFPQIFKVNFTSIFDTSRDYLYEKKAEIVSKHTFNLDNDVEIDIGGYLFLRDVIGVGNIFSTLRFYTLNSKLFHSFSYMYGERNSFSFETNYLINHNLILDYRYKKKFMNDKSKHSTGLYNICNNNSKTCVGLSYNNEGLFKLFAFGKKYINHNISLGCKLKISTLYEAKIRFKFKEALGKFYTIVYLYKISLILNFL